MIRHHRDQDRTQRIGDDRRQRAGIAAPGYNPGLPACGNQVDAGVALPQTFAAVQSIDNPDHDFAKWFTNEKPDAVFGGRFLRINGRPTAMTRG